MCTTTKPAVLSKTQILVNEVKDGDQKVNILGYQNIAFSEGPCSMILPVPSAEKMDHDNTIDMTGADKLFSQYVRILTPVTRGRISKETVYSTSLDSIQIFDSGDYTVVLTHNADPDEVKAALEFVAPEKRPEYNQEVYEALQELYPGWHLPICCWSGSIRPAPIMWKYVPMPLFVENHFAPGLDGHDGHKPDLTAQVGVDHALIVGIEGQGNLLQDNAVQRVNMLAPEPVRKWLPNRITGLPRIEGTLPNGDWVLPKKGWTPRNIRTRCLERVSPQ